jgi:hypothetical protein
VIKGPNFDKMIELEKISGHRVAGKLKYALLLSNNTAKMLAQVINNRFNQEEIFKVNETSKYSVVCAEIEGSNYYIA